MNPKTPIQEMFVTSTVIDNIKFSFFAINNPEIITPTIKRINQSKLVEPVPNRNFEMKNKLIIRIKNRVIFLI